MPIASATSAKFGLSSSVPKFTKPAAFISSSTKFSEELLNTTILTGSLFWRSVSSSPEQHREPAVAGQRDHLAAGIGGLRADRVRHGVGHRCRG